VSLEWFHKLKEIDSLGKMRINHLQKMRDQQERVSKLFARRDDNLMQTTTLNHELNMLQQNLFETEKKLTLASVQKENLRSLGESGEKIHRFENEIEKLENNGLDILTEIESKQNEIHDLKKFLEGLLKTMAEIEGEVNQEKETLEKEVFQYDERLKFLEEELPDNFQSLYQRVLKKNLALGPFTRTDQGSCFFCRYKISKQDEIEIDMHKDLKQCHQCGRIFLPYGA
jgi:predicted  nucleic acid-binding Zn-ribbon protein